MSFGSVRRVRNATQCGNFATLPRPRAPGRRHRTVPFVPQPELIPVVLFHRHGVVREALQLRLEAEQNMLVTASVATSGELLDAVATAPRAIVVMEQQPTEPDGMSLVAELRSTAPEVRMVMLVDSAHTETGDLPVVVAALKAGVAGIIRCQTPSVALVDTVRTVARGAAVIDLDALRALAAVWADSPRNPLSLRERDVLACLACGLTNAEAAAKLYVSRETVKTHVAHVLRKLEVDDRAAAVDKALRLGLLAVGPSNHEARKVTCEF